MRRSLSYPHGGGDAVREVFNSDYTLGTTESIFDVARAQNYAAALVDLCPGIGPARVLEAGCGAGLVLRSLSTIWTNATFTGLEAAPLLAAQKGDSPRISIRQQFLEDMPAEGSGFDLIFAINVLEHAANPRDFLQAAARQVSANGKVILICPDATEPNVELLFLDHRHSFTGAALARFAEKSGLELTFFEDTRPCFEDLRIYVFVPHPQGTSNRPTLRCDSSAELHRRRSNYLVHWSKLDSGLLERTKESRRILAFGAGEAAALLRAYAPRFWGKVEALVVDQPLHAEHLDKPVNGDASPATRFRANPGARHPSQKPGAHRRAADR